ncbi:hypothetical protein CGMCC3_g17789 [Colletotrichum fructicola]|uniref:Uncharacterized protein n=1 Tax=Colletotrichum fructicola (strain Nara gc5) TaxID=1213859 RepID=A0A7J6IMY8_COLFN|nr:uncharacterized protein CGMCC3_g17789 [Colletotrichum fructicola]KAE9566038.1 hypothetical protein CGMCC3_g17789 [Colletotrichum fructicola]KAF4417842.1 hypothetical protein CFRS1_v015088 [Colletotrichum fructicola]KAF4477591.1 hypothetical protein CGGC5_v013104 [Colletotrichum fructicola Nara gc5]
MFQGPWRESRSRVPTEDHNTKSEVLIEDYDDEATLIVMRIIHDQSDMVPGIVVTKCSKLNREDGLTTWKNNFQRSTAEILYFGWPPSFPAASRRRD